MLLNRYALVLAALVAAWISVVTILANSGWFVVEDGPPWKIALSVALPLLGFAALWRSEGVRSYLLGLDRRLVLATQLWRIVGAAFLFGWAVDDLDGSFAIPAGIGDIATGLLAFVMLGALLNGTLTRGRLALFTAVGIGDFAIALTTGALFRPQGIEEMPWVLFPALAVPFFAAIHFLNWRQLVTEGDRSPAVPSALEQPSPTAILGRR